MLNKFSVSFQPTEPFFFTLNHNKPFSRQSLLACFLQSDLLAGGDVRVDQRNSSSCRMFSTWYPRKLTRVKNKTDSANYQYPPCSHAGTASSQIRPPAWTQRCACIPPAWSLRESGFICGELSSAESELQLNPRGKTLHLLWITPLDTHTASEQVISLRRSSFHVIASFAVWKGLNLQPRQEVGFFKP